MLLYVDVNTGIEMRRPAAAKLWTGDMAVAVAVGRSVHAASVPVLHENKCV